MIALLPAATRKRKNPAGAGLGSFQSAYPAFGLMVEASRFAVIIILPHRRPLGCDRRHIFAHFRAAG
jgi:hypothetical protein